VVDKEIDISTGDLVEQVLQGIYTAGAELPREIVVTTTPDDNDALESVLSDIRGRGRVQIHTAQRGEKANLMQTATLNAQQSLMLYKTRRSADFATRSTALADIQEALGMEDAPLRMECYDVSHLSGTNIVASMVVFEDGLPRKDQYRRFNIPQSTDDTESIYQTLSRRLSRLDDELAPVEEVGEQRKRFAYRPNLLIVDGGQPQVAAARRALDDAGVTDIALCGIAKRLEEIWLPDDDFPVILPRNSDALFLIQRIRDEAHRFAITHQRQRRKRDISTQLAEIPGLGPSRVAVLLKHFGSVKRLKEAEAADISAVRGIGPTLASAVVERLRGDEQVDVDAPAPPSSPA
jgi:excinuclease ABC subunit C